MDRYVTRLETRICCAGPDATFGTNGQVQLAETFAVEHVLGITNAIFAQGRNINFDAASGRGVIKLAPNGTPDATWAGGGQADVPFADITQLAYDKWRDKLLIVGTDSRDGTSPPAATSLRILRLNPDGSADTSFGNNGLVTYTPPSVALGKATEAWVTPQTINVLRDGGLLVGMSVTSRTSSGGFDDDGFYLGGGDGTIEAELLRLRPNGTRQPSFGHRGIKVIASGVTTDSNNADDITQFHDRYDIHQVRPLANGGFSVLMSREQYSYENVYGSTVDTVDVLIRDVESNGAFADSDSPTWLLHDAHWDDNEGTRDRFTLADAVLTDSGAAVLARTDTVGTVVYSMTDANQPVAHRIDIPQEAEPTTIVRRRRGFVLLNEGAGQVSRGVAVRLNNQFHIAKTWGNNGALTFAAGNIIHLSTPADLALDADGRVLSFVGRDLNRFNP